MPKASPLAEEYLTEGMKTARQADDKGGILAVLNELIGYYRVRGEYEKCVLCSKEAYTFSASL